jgi:transcriptional regulator with XRE-family HTH domain
MIGEEIRRRRKEKGLTLAQLASKAGMAQSAVSQIETGKRTPSSESVIKLANALDIEVGDLYPKKAQAPLPLEQEDVSRRQGWQSLARVRSELLEEIAELWDTQLDEGQHDWRTIQAIESAGFRLFLNHVHEAKEMKRWLTPDQLAQLEHAEKRYEDHVHNIVGLLRQVAEEEKKRLSEAEVIDLERYVAQREAAHQRHNLTA